MTEYNTKILKLNEIAAWWLPEAMKSDLRIDVQATLPSLQRGFVWKSNQIEMLWDSIAQGFPIGSLLLTEYDKDKPKNKIITTPGHGSVGELPNITHLILDGQQRATAISLGFRNIWTDPINTEKDKPTEALWVDLVKLTKGERKFSFRVITKAHPWGYKRSDPSSRLSASMAREALKQYQKFPDNENKKPHDLDLNRVFPWDAKAPVPLALLMASVRKYASESDIDSIYDKIIENFRERLFNMPQWSNWCDIDQFKKSENIINNTNDNCLKELIFGLHNALLNIEVPTPVLTAFKYDKDKTEHDITKNNDKPDENAPIFNLFKRINNAGTPLSREEINYSMLKAIWPGAKEAIEGERGLLGDRQFAQPARMASLIIRLYIMLYPNDTDRRNINTLQAELTISQFSARLNDDAFNSGIILFCEGKGKDIIRNTWRVLTEGESALPVVLAARLSQQADDLVLLLMYWLAQPKVKIDNNRPLGFIVALSWFAADLNRCVRKLAKKLHELIKSNANLDDFFNNERFHMILERDESGRVLMRPLPPPNKLCDVLRNKILGSPDFKLLKKESPLWENNDLWQHFRGNNGDEMPKEMFEFFSSHLGGNENDDKEKISDVWWVFLRKTLNERRFLLYAQRKFINDNYGWFDPTLPDQIRDHNRPWDYDHILPHSWSHHISKNSERVKSDISCLVRLWVNVNGNLRAWPLELNRSKGNHEIIEENAEEYSYSNITAVCDASFIRGDGEVWGEIEGKVREGKAPDNGDNKYFWEEGEHWKLFIEASIDRSVDIYKEWYDNLSISDLMKN